MRIRTTQARVMVFASVAAMIILVSGATIQRAFAFNEAERNQMRQQLVSKFCEQTEWMSCFGEQPSQCADVVSRFIKPCLNQHLENGNEPITDPERARKIALEIIKCFNTEFAMSHPMGKTKSPECANAPQHLQ